jgi:cell wall-associated NlpC family hydrolase
LQFAVEGAAQASATVLVTEKPSVVGRRLLLALLALAMAVALVAVESPAATQAATSEAGRVTNFAANQLGKNYRWGATGLRTYDCSGLVYRAFAETGLLARIGSSRKTARGYYDWFRRRGLASRRNPRRGDLVVWGNARHIGIYIGNGLAISALTNGVSRHAINRINISFTAYLHVKLSR